MSDRRAAIRREKMERMKIEKHKSPVGDMERAYMQWTMDGRVLAVCIVFCILKEQYKFTTGKLNKLLQLGNQEAIKFYQPATMFNLSFYHDRMMEKLSKVKLNITVNGAKERAYVERRNELFISSCALMFIVLNQEFGFASNSKGTGRTDIIMEYAMNEFIKFNLDKDYSVDWYIKRLEEKTGVKLVD